MIDSIPIVNECKVMGSDIKVKRKCTNSKPFTTGIYVKPDDYPQFKFYNHNELNDVCSKYNWVYGEIEHVIQPYNDISLYDPTCVKDLLPINTLIYRGEHNTTLRWRQTKEMIYYHKYRATRILERMLDRLNKIEKPTPSEINEIISIEQELVQRAKEDRALNPFMLGSMEFFNMVECNVTHGRVHYSPFPVVPLHSHNKLVSYLHPYVEGYVLYRQYIGNDIVSINL